MSRVTPNGPSKTRWFDWRIVPMFAVTALLMWALVRHFAGSEEFWGALRRTRASYAPLILLMVLMSLTLSIARWRLLLAALGYAVPFRLCAEAVLTSWPLALVVPARAGDVVRAAVIREHVPFWEATGSVVAEKAIDVHNLAMIATVATVVHGFYLWTGVAASVVVAEWAFVLLVARYRHRLRGIRRIDKIVDKLEQLIRAFTALFRQPRYFFGVSAASLLAWALTVSLVYVLFLSTDARVSLGLCFSLWPLAMFAGLLPFTVAGMGTRDGAFVYMLDHATGAEPLREGAILAATFGYAFVVSWFFAALGLPFAMRFLLRSRARS